MFRSTLVQSTRLVAGASSSSSASVLVRLGLPTAAGRLASAGSSSSAGGLQRRAYHEKVMDHYNKPRNVRPPLLLAALPPSAPGERRPSLRRAAVDPFA